MPWQPRVSTGGSLITSKCPGGSCHRGRPTGCGIKIIYDHGDGGLKAREARHKKYGGNIFQGSSSLQAICQSLKKVMDVLKGK